MDTVYPTLRNFLLLLLLRFPFPFSSTFSPSCSSSWASDILHFLPIVVHLQLVQRVLRHVYTQKRITFLVSSSHKYVISHPEHWFLLIKKNPPEHSYMMHRRKNGKVQTHTRWTDPHIFYIKHPTFKQTSDPVSAVHSAFPNKKAFKLDKFKVYYQVSWQTQSKILPWELHIT